MSEIHDGIHIGKWQEAVGRTDIAFCGESNGHLLGYFKVTEDGCGWDVGKGNNSAEHIESLPELAALINEYNLPEDGWTW